MEIKNFQDFVIALTSYWTDLGCIWSQPYDFAMGAGTFHPHTFLKGIGPEPWRAVYVQPCRRPVDGRYGKSTYRFQHYYQLQVLLKPSPANIVDLFLKSLETVGIKLQDNDIGLLEDDWKGPTLGAWGLGWEVRANGQEVTQFTYFQQLGGLDLDVVSGEITYGTERLYMYSKGISNALEMPYNDHFTYGDIFYQNEFEFSHFNFKEADVKQLFAHFDLCEGNVTSLCEKGLVLPAYDYVLQASHTFNLLDARGAISVSERQRFIGRVRDCARQCASVYLKEREKLGFPMQARLESDARQTLEKGGKARLELNANAEPYTSPKTGLVNEFVFELGVEEMPPSFQTSAVEMLEAKLSEFLKTEAQTFAADTAFASKLKDMSTRVFAAPRRLAIVAKNIPTFEPDKTLEVWGPAARIAKTADGKLSPAGEGFCKKNGIDPAAVTFKSKDGSEFLYVEKKVSGRDVCLTLAEAIKNWCHELPAGLKMRWLPGEICGPFIRPVRWVVALADKQVVPVELFGLKTGRVTYGQRILAPGAIRLADATEYLPSLRKAFVEPDHNVRRNAIVTKSEELAKSVGGRVWPDESLLDKCVGLSESPDIFIGKFDEKYLNLPQKLVVSVLREHMNYFSVQGQSGDLLPGYIGVAGYKCNKPEKMVEGTLAVVVGRLDDGAFYFETDLACPVASFREGLKSQMFQGGMGTLFDKTERVAALAEKLLAAASPGAKNDVTLTKVVRAAGELCKADLKTGCVQEFPDEMQGLMGQILVERQQPFGADSKAVALAIGEHYLPAGASSPLPTSAAGRYVSLADKLDSLAMFINSGADVKGNKDPFALRRLALGVLRLLGMDGAEPLSIRLRLSEAASLALENMKAFGWKISADAGEKLVGFCQGRLRAGWRDEFDVGAVEAVCARLDLLDIASARELALATTKALSETGPRSFRAAIVPYKRSKNLTQNVMPGESALDPKLFSAEEEKVLYEKLLGIETKTKAHLSANDFKNYLSTLVEITDPLAKFFDAVMVNDNDLKIRNNRLALLMKIRSLYEQTADFSMVQVD